VNPITIYPIKVVGDVGEGTDIGALICEAVASAEFSLRDSDVVVVTQKIVSKAEGRIAIVPDGDREAVAALVEKEAARIVRRRGNFIIAETKHGLVCANAGIDSSNVEPGMVTLLPLDSDRSARRIRARIKRTSGADVAVIVSDTFGRAWRIGQTNIAIGVAGMTPLNDYAGTKDTFGTVLRVTNIAIADELAGAAEMVMGKAEEIPLAVIRGAPVQMGRGNARQLVRPLQDDLFR